MPLKLYSAYCMQLNSIYIITVSLPLSTYSLHQGTFIAEKCRMLHVANKFPLPGLHLKYSILMHLSFYKELNTSSRSRTEQILKYRTSFIYLPLQISYHKKLQDIFNKISYVYKSIGIAP